jgi:hypothetical protein
MILKTKQAQAAYTPQTKAGLKQEQDVAFFLRRAFKDHPQVLVINDFKFRFNDETAQIDHLIVYSYGFILIESKSFHPTTAVVIVFTCVFVFTTQESPPNDSATTMIIGSVFEANEGSSRPWHTTSLLNAQNKHSRRLKFIH